MRERLEHVFFPTIGGQRDFFFGSQSFIKNKTEQKKPYRKTPEFIRWITDLQNSMQFRFNRANFKTIGSLVQMWGRSSLCNYCCSQNPNSSPIKKKQNKNRIPENASLKFSLETMEGTTGQKQGPRQTPQQVSKCRTERRPRPAPPRPRLKPSLNSFRSKRCTSIWHDKQRENGAIPIWNF